MHDLLLVQLSSESFSVIAKSKGNDYQSKLVFTLCYLSMRLIATCGASQAIGLHSAGTQSREFIEVQADCTETAIADCTIFFALLKATL